MSSIKQFPSGAFALIGLLLVAPRAFAHDPLEIAADARVLAGKIECDMVFVWRTALLAANDTETQQHRDPSRAFDAVQPLLVKRAPEFLSLFAGKDAIRPSVVEVALTPEYHVHIRLRFGLPRSGAFRFSATILEALPRDDYRVIFTVTDRDGRFLRRYDLHAGQPVADVVLPADERR